MITTTQIPFSTGEIVFDADGECYEVRGTRAIQCSVATFHPTGVVYDMSDPLVYYGSFSRKDPLGPRPIGDANETTSPKSSGGA